MADMVLEQACEWDSMEHWYSCRPSKVLQCRSCKKKNLKWHQVKGYWVLFEPDGSRLHTCEGYTPPFDALKELAHATINVTRMNELERLYNRMMKAGGLRKIINIVTDSQLLDLFIRVNREHKLEDRYEIGWSSLNDYSKHLSQLRAEILRRMNKNV